LDRRVFVCPRTSPDHRSLAFDRVRSWSFYDGAMVQAILFLKFENIQPLGELFTRMLAEMAVLGGRRLKPTWSSPSPCIAALIAKSLAKRLGLPYKSVLLTRIRPRPEKHLFTLDERWESVRGAFATRPGSQVDNLRVLLVDDVMTTGATLDSCAKTLREAGAKSVVGLTVASARLRNSPG
jgi:competence protein ComFC